MGTYLDLGDSVVGAFLLGKARTIVKKYPGNLLCPSNKERYELVRRTRYGAKAGIRSECHIKKKCKSKIPSLCKKLIIHDQQDDFIFANDIYCECEKGESCGKKGRRFLKIDNVKHGSGFEFKGDVAIAVVMKEFTQSSSFSLAQYFTFDDLID